MEYLRNLETQKKKRNTHMHMQQRLSVYAAMPD